MRHALVRKLKSGRGASILMGLLLLLVCAMAGAAALTAAGSNAGRYTHLRQDQQRYLAVASAARLVRDELCGGEYTASAELREIYTHYTTTDPETGAVSWHTRGPEYTLDPAVENTCAGSFRNWLGPKALAFFQAGQVPGEWWDLGGRMEPATPDSLKLEDLKVRVEGVDEELLDQVKWSLEMGPDYTITAHFQLEETDEAGNTAAYYATTLTIPAQVKAEQTMRNESAGSRDITVTAQSVTVTWPAEGAVIRQE